MSDPIVRIDEGLDDVIPYSWDTEWRNDVGDGCGDWVIAENDPDAEGAEIERNRGGLKAQNALGTSILICLFTDRRKPPYIDASDGSTDPRGWWGDAVDIDETLHEGPLGSNLWLLARAPNDYQTLIQAEHYAAEALQTLVNQGAVHHFEIEAYPFGHDQIRLKVKAFDPTGKELIFIDSPPIQ
ncbi:MAG: phage GP46 family protein [Anaerolineae bacterium]|nr:phage GP46 family protein [Anaerolineae bacterium]